MAYLKKNCQCLRFGYSQLLPLCCQVVCMRDNHDDDNNDDNDDEGDQRILHGYACFTFRTFYYQL